MKDLNEMKKTLASYDGMIGDNDRCRQYMVEAQARLKAEIAALEAQQSKQSEYVIAVTDTGQIYGQWTDIPHGSKFERVTVVKKKPFVITEEMAKEYSKVISKVVCYGGYSCTPLAVCLHLKLFGIDAVAAE